MARTFVELQIAQAKPAGTSATTAFAASGSRYVVRQVCLSNNTGAASNVDIWLDDDGTTYNNTTQIYGAKAIPTDTTIVIDVYWPVADGGSIGVATSTGGAVNFTFYGVEMTD